LELETFPGLPAKFDHQPIIIETEECGRKVTIQHVFGSREIMNKRARIKILRKREKNGHPQNELCGKVCPTRKALKAETGPNEKKTEVSDSESGTDVEFVFDENCICCCCTSERRKRQFPELIGNPCCCECEEEKYGHMGELELRVLDDARIAALTLAEEEMWEDMSTEASEAEEEAVLKRVVTGLLDGVEAELAREDQKLRLEAEIKLGQEDPANWTADSESDSHGSESDSDSESEAFSDSDSDSDTSSSEYSSDSEGCTIEPMALLLPKKPEHIILDMEFDRSHEIALDMSKLCREVAVGGGRNHKKKKKRRSRSSSDSSLSSDESSEDDPSEFSSSSSSSSSRRKKKKKRRKKKKKHHHHKKSKKNKKKSKKKKHGKHKKKHHRRSSSSTSSSSSSKSSSSDSESDVVSDRRKKKKKKNKMRKVRKG
jgi:hypothetical protein